MGVAKNGRDRSKKVDTVHKVSKLSEVHDPAVRFPLTKISSGYEIGQIHKKRPFSQKKPISQKGTPVFIKFENLETNLNAGVCTSDNLETLWTVCNFFSGDHAHFWPHPLFHFTHG